MTLRTPIAVHLADTGARSASAMRFLTVSYREAFGLEPSAPDFLFYAEQEGEIVGTIGLTASRGGRHAILDRYCLHEEAATLSGIEFGRWSSRSATASLLLIRTATAFALSGECTYGWCEQTRVVNRHAARLGIFFSKPENATLDIKRVEPRHRPYYESSIVELYQFDLAQAFAALKANERLGVLEGR